MDVIKGDMVSAAQYAKLRQNLYWYIAVSCIIAIGALFFALWAKDTHDRTASELYITKANLDSVSKLTVRFMNKDSLEVVENISLKAQNEGVIRELSEKVFNLSDNQAKLIKKVAYFAQLKQKVDFHVINIPYDSLHPVPLIARGRSDSLGVPQSFSVSDSAYEVSGVVTKKGVSIEHLILTNNLYLREGTKKKGFLNLGREDFVQALNTNAYIQNTGIVSLTLRKRPSAWNRWIKPVISFGAGAYLMYQVRK